MTILYFAAISFALGAEPVAGTMPDASQVRITVERSLPFIEKQGVEWINERKCVSCHHTAFLVWSHTAAADSGFAVDRDKLSEWRDWSIEKLLSFREVGKEGEKKQEQVGVRNLEGLSQLMLAQGRVPVDEKNRELFKQFVSLILTGQQEDGSWKPGGQLPSQKRPQRETADVYSMWAVLALASYEELDERIEESRLRTLAWLEKSPGGKTSEWLALKMMTAKRFGSKEAADKLMKQLLGRQNADGGWSWGPGKPSDALATGQVLYALKTAGLQSDHPAIGKAWKFLVTTQRDDGSWSVKSTKKSKQTEALFTSIFWGTTWAAIGLSETLPRQEQ